MRNRWNPLASAVFALVAVVGCGGDAPPARTAPPDAKRVDTAKAATLTGRVLLDGQMPATSPIKMSGDPVCIRENKDGAVFETVVGEDGGLGNVFVYVKDGLGGYFFDTPSESAKLDQKGCRYEPHVLGAQVGQNVEFINSDATLHTVHAVGSNNPEFNFSQPIQTQKDTKFFAKPEVMVRMKCDIHTWMSAYIGVLEHPYFAVTPRGGSFEIKNLPAGTYTVEAWHEKLGSQTRSVTVAENGQAQITFTFKAAAPAP